MAHFFCVRRNATPINRDALIKFAEDRGIDLLVSDDDIVEGKTVHTASDIGIVWEGVPVWLGFGDDASIEAYNMSLYGRNTSGSDEVFSLAAALGTEVISEYDDEFAKHTFPVDVDTTTPLFERGGWQFFTDDQVWVYPYHKDTKTYCSQHALEISDITDSYLDELIAEMNEEL